MSNLKVKAEELLHKVTPGHKTGHGSTNAGPHDSNAANKLDPSVDSDLDGSRNAGATSTSRTAGFPGNDHAGTTHTGTHTGLGGTGTTHTSTTHGSTNAGPHNSNIANKLDPTVDSDLDGSRNAGVRSNNNHGAHTAGPHSSNIANKADPRVDSDLSNTHNTGVGAGHTGHSHNGGLGAGNTGLSGGTTHSSVTGTGLTGTAGTGPAPNTAGPHKSDLLNKADPRVDSDLNGSKTVGGNTTYN